MKAAKRKAMTEAARGELCNATLSSYIAGKKIKHNLSWWKENSADLKVPNKILLKSSLHYSLSTIVNKSDMTKLNTAIEKVNYLSKSHALLK